MSVLKQKVSLSIDGTEKQFHSIKLFFGTAGPFGYISLPADCKTGAPVQIDLMWSKGKTNSIFTGHINKLETRESKPCAYVVTNEQLLDKTMVATGWEKTSLKTILTDILNDCEITDTNIVDPGITLKRFSYPELPARAVIEKILLTLNKSHGLKDYEYYFDNNNIFNFGPKTELTTKENIEIEKGNNLIETSGRRYEIFALPVFYNQKVNVNGKDFVVDKSFYEFTPNRKRVVFEVAV